MTELLPLKFNPYICQLSKRHWCEGILQYALSNSATVNEGRLYFLNIVSLLPNYFPKCTIWSFLLGLCSIITVLNLCSLKFQHQNI